MSVSADNTEVPPQWRHSLSAGDEGRCSWSVCCLVRGNYEDGWKIEILFRSNSNTISFFIACHWGFHIFCADAEGKLVCPDYWEWDGSWQRRHKTGWRGEKLPVTSDPCTGFTEWHHCPVSAKLSEPRSATKRGSVCMCLCVCMCVSLPALRIHCYFFFLTGSVVSTSGDHDGLTKTSEGT